MKKNPPKYAFRFLQWFCRADFLDEIEGDLLELFQMEAEKSESKARMKFVRSVLAHFRPEYIKFFHQSKRSNSSNNMVMLKSYLILALRNMKKRASFSLINISGLALGLCACLIILHYMNFELSYDGFHANKDNIYRLYRTIERNGDKPADVPLVAVTTYGLGPALLNELPEVKNFVRTHDINSTITYKPKEGELKVFHENRMLAADSTLFDVFTFEGISGDLTTALNQPNSIVLTESIAKKYFGDKNPVGEQLSLAGGRLHGDYTVTAVMEDVPENSNFKFEMLVSMYNLLQTQQYTRENGWGMNNFYSYIQLNPGADLAAAEAKLADFSARQLDPQWQTYGLKIRFHLQPLKEIHLQTNVLVNVETVSRSSVYSLGVIAVFILIIAWINYINLSTARAMERAREVGIKKAIGVSRGGLMMQFFTESVLINFIAIVLAVVLTSVLLPKMGAMIDKDLQFASDDYRLWLILVGLFVLGTLASGVYPAFVLSSFKTVKALKGGNQQDGKGISLRKALVVFQFAASLVLMAGTFAVYRQINYMQSQDKGLAMDQMLIVRGPGTLDWETAQQRMKVFKEKAKQLPGVEAITTSGSIPGAGANWGADVRKSGAPQTDIKLGYVVYVDPDFIPTYEIPFVAGGNFNPEIPSSMQSIIINESSLAAYDLGTAEEAIGQKLVLESDTATVIGVLKNYNWESLRTEFQPYLFMPDEVVPNNLSIHLTANMIPESIDALGEIYSELVENEPFDYYFLDDSFNTQYKADQLFGKIFAVFASLAVVISCLGLWGLALFTTALKMKEIGVRKVLGASVNSIVYLLSGRFVKLVLVSSLIALPLAWYGISQWLNDFAFSIGMQWDFLLLPLVVLLLIALLTVSAQVLKGAVSNPVKVLRSE